VIIQRAKFSNLNLRNKKSSISKQESFMPIYGLFWAAFPQLIFITCRAAFPQHNSHYV